MDDLISRQVAIDAVCMEWCKVKHQDCKHPFDFEKYGCYWCEGCETALRTLPNLPFAQPERKKGEWKMKWHSFFHREIPMCSQCLRVSAFKYNFCPYCGAEMREEKDNE